MGLLTLQDVSVARGGLPLVEGVTLTLGAGQGVLLRGPNGVGKTTLLRAIAGLQPVRAGTVTTDPDLLAYAGHADGVKATLSVKENLVFWAGIFGGGDVDAVMEAMNLTGLADRAARDLSAGQRRRLGLARLLVTHRPLWLLDEPTVSLDAASAALFEGLLAQHLADGGAALISTHLPIAGIERVLDLGQHRAKLPELQP